MPNKKPAAMRRARAARDPARAIAHPGSPAGAALFERLFEATPDASLLVSPAGKIVLANQSAGRIFGYSPAELNGRYINLLFSGDAQSPLEGQEVPLPPSRLAALSGEQPARRKDSSLVTVEVTLNPLAAGSQSFTLITARDVSGRQQRESLVNQQEALVHLLQDVAIAANETESVIMAVRYTLDRLQKHLNWTLGHAFLVDEDNSMSPMQVWVGKDLERFSIFRAVTEALRLAPGEGLAGIIENNHQPAWLNDLPGQAQFARAREARQVGLQTALGIPIIAGKDLVGMLEFFHTQDIPSDPNLLAVLPHVGVQLGRVIERHRTEETLRKQAAQLHLVMNNLPVILLVIDRQGRLLLIEGKSARAGSPETEALIGKSIFSQMASRPDVTSLLRRALAGEEIHTEIAGYNATIFETFFTPYFDANWAVDGVIGLSFDVSERKRMEAELEELKRRLLDSSDAERARLAQQLHDGPLQDLYGAFYQIQEIRQLLDPSGQEAANRALQTIQDVNATLLMICGELHPNTLVHLGLGYAIRGYAERLQERYQNTAIHLDLDEDEKNDPTELPLALRLGIFRVFQQLLSNAVRHSVASEIWVRLMLSSEQAVLEVQDNGQGFQLPSRWIDLARENKYGLVNAIDRAQGIHGKLDIESQPGKGTLARLAVKRS